MKYPFLMYKMKVDEHEFWVAESKSLKGCIGQGDTANEAYLELEVNEIEWIHTAEEYNISIPEVPITKEKDAQYSGKFTVRISPQVHKQASEQAEQQGISLNQYVNNAIISQNSGSIVDNYLKQVNELIISLKQSIKYTPSPEILHSFQATSYNQKEYKGSFLPVA